MLALTALFNTNKMAKKKYEVLKGKDGFSVNGINLSTATQAQLKQIHSLGHPYIKLVTNEQETTDKQDKTDSTEKA